VNTVRYIKRSEINRQKWDALIDASLNSLPYALSWYLDAVAENWDALVLNDYQAVMPLVWLRKFGVKCLYQPYYCQQLGVFAANDLPSETIEQFIAITAQKFSYVDINLNPWAGKIAGLRRLLPKKNLLLDTSGNYVTLKKNYTENHRRNISKALKAELHFSEESDVQSFQKFYLGNVNRKKENFKPKHEKIFLALSASLVKQGHGKIFTATGQEGKYYAAILVIFQKKRMISIINTSSPAGKKNGA